MSMAKECGHQADHLLVHVRSLTNKVCSPWLVCLRSLKEFLLLRKAILFGYYNAEHFIHVQFVTEQEGNRNAVEVSVIGSEKCSGNSGASELWSPLADGSDTVSKHR